MDRLCTPPTHTSVVHVIRPVRLMPRPGLCPPCNARRAAERLPAGSIRPYQTRGGAGHIVPASQHAVASVASPSHRHSAGRPSRSWGGLAFALVPSAGGVRPLRIVGPRHCQVWTRPSHRPTTIRSRPNKQRPGGFAHETTTPPALREMPEWAARSTRHSLTRWHATRLGP